MTHHETHFFSMDGASMLCRTPALLLAGVAWGCSASSAGLNVGDESGGTVTGTGGSVESGGVVGSGGLRLGDATVGALSVRIDDETGMEVHIVVIGCPGDCVTVDAVVSGGNGPYSYAWENGSKEAQRTVCANANQNLNVVATGSGTSGGEFQETVQTSMASAQTRTLSCDDSGTPTANADAGIEDSGVVETGDGSVDGGTAAYNCDNIDDNVCVRLAVDQVCPGYLAVDLAWPTTGVEGIVFKFGPQPDSGVNFYDIFLGEETGACGLTRATGSPFLALPNLRCAAEVVSFREAPKVQFKRAAVTTWPAIALTDLTVWQCPATSDTPPPG